MDNNIKKKKKILSFAKFCLARIIRIKRIKLDDLDTGKSLILKHFLLLNFCSLLTVWIDGRISGGIIYD